MQPFRETARARSFHLEIFLISFAALILEICYTRIFSFKLYYYFAYLIIGIALLGLGSGAVFVAILPRLRRLPPERLVPLASLAVAAAVGLGYLAIAAVQLDTLHLGSEPRELLNLLLLTVPLFLPFLGTGIAISSIFSHRTRSIDSLYAADLTGAGLACAAVIPVMNAFTPPGGVFLAGTLFALTGAVATGAGSGPRRAVGLILAAGLALAVVFPQLLPEPRAGARKTLGRDAAVRDAVVFSRWSPVFRVDVTEELDRVRMIIHDGMIGSTLHRFDGDLASLERFDRDPRALPFRLLRPQPRVLIIGAAGGHEVLAALHFRAEQVTAVELNPVTVSLLTDHFADFTGHLGQHERVSLVVDDGRSYLAGRDERYDLIFFVAPDSYATMNAASSGAYVLSESYLYTREMVELALEHLAPGGIVCMQFGEVDYARRPLRTARYAATARAAFASLGLGDFARSILVSTAQGLFTNVTILLTREGFTAQQVDAFEAQTRAIPRAVPRYVQGEDLESGAVNRVIELSDELLPTFLAAYPYRITPVTDDSPFFWHFARFRDVLAERAGGAGDGVRDLEVGRGERVLLSMLVFVTLYAGLFLMLPFATVRATFAQLPCRARTFVYFGCLGVGFMLFEICIMQMLTLLLGYPTYSLTVTLLSLLVFAGVGSATSRRLLAHRNRSLVGLYAALVGLALFFVFGLPLAIDALVGSGLALRTAAAVAFVAPLGWCLGAFLPLGLATVSSLSEHEVEYVAWAWAVNGFFAVISSVGTTILCMAIGFSAVLGLALLVYAVGIASLWRIPCPAPA